MKWMHETKDRQTSDKWINGWMGWMDKWMDEWTGGCMDGLTDGQRTERRMDTGLAFQGASCAVLWPIIPSQETL